jgi:opacity protein-like surface antigen
MKPRFIFTAMLAGVLAFAAVAGAQTRDRGYVLGIGGSTTTEVTSPFFGGAVGFNLTPDLWVTGEVGRMHDVYANFTKDDLKAVEQGFANEGVLLTTTFKMPTNYVTGGVRWAVPTTYQARPYLTASGGFARLDPKPGFIAQGIDITSVALQEPALKTAFEKQNRPLMSLGGGLSIDVAKHLTADVGYRFSRIFVNTDFLQDIASPHAHKGFNLHRAYAGAGVKF